MKPVKVSGNLKNSIWNFADVFFYPSLFFITTPFFIDNLGEESFGIWILVNSIMISMQVFSFGLGPAVFKNIAAHIGVGATDKMGHTLNTNLSLSLLIHVFCVVAAALLAVGIRQFGFFGLQGQNAVLASYGALLGGFMVGFKFYEQIVSYAFKAFERFDIAAVINSGTKLTALLINIVLVTFDFGLLWLFLSIIIISVIGICIGLSRLKKLIPDYKPELKLKKELVLKELNFAIWPWFQSLIIIVTFQFDRFFVVTFLGLSTLAYYGLAATMFNHIHMGFNSIAPWLAPKITKMTSKGLDTTELYHNTRNVSLFLSLSALLIFGYVYSPVLEFILGESKFLRTDNYIKLFAVFELYFVYSIIPNYFLNASGHEKLYFKLVLFYCITIIVGMFAGYYYTKSAEGLLTGMTAATAISMFVQDIAISSKVFNHIDIPGSTLQFIPAILIMFSLISINSNVKLMMTFASVFSLYLVFFRYYNIKFKPAHVE